MLTERGGGAVLSARFLATGVWRWRLKTCGRIRRGKVSSLATLAKENGGGA
jgi:hypothetical protein